MKHTFTATIEQADSGGAFVVVPFDVEAAFGKKRVPVQAVIDGVPYRGSVVSMGGTRHVLGVLKEIRAAIGKDIGGTVEVVLEEDTAPREVEVPADLQTALAGAPAARECFAGLSYSRQREYVLWIESAKREATRSERIATAVQKLSRGEKLRER